MKTRMWIAAAAMFCAVGIVMADDPPAPTSQPATKPVSPEQVKINQILADQEAADKKLKTLSAKMVYEKEDVFGDKVKKTGRFVYLKPNKFRIDFEFRIVNKRILVEGKAYIFDGKQLLLVNKPRKRVTIFILPPPKPGQKPANALQLGKGPFPMPFGQKAETIRKLFDVKLIPPTEAETKAGLDHLRLTPKKGTSLAKKYKWIDFWFDKEVKLPLKLRYMDSGENVVTVTFEKKGLKVNDPKVTVKDFAQPKVGADWSVVREPL